MHFLFVRELCFSHQDIMISCSCRTSTVSSCSHKGLCIKIGLTNARDEHGRSVFVNVCHRDGGVSDENERYVESHHADQVGDADDYECWILEQDRIEYIPC